ncbi:MAG: Fatty-acyl-CoA oxidase, related to yeast fatty acid beta-oxidation enzyme POX1, partial [uncultured Nocardioides sp.]
RSRQIAPGSWSTAGSPVPGPRRSAARSTTCAARSGPSPSTSSMPSGCRRRCSGPRSSCR